MSFRRLQLDLTAFRNAVERLRRVGIGTIRRDHPLAISTASRDFSSPIRRARTLVSVERHQPRKMFAAPQHRIAELAPVRREPRWCGVRWG